MIYGFRSNVYFQNLELFIFPKVSNDTKYILPATRIRHAKSQSYIITTFGNYSYMNSIIVYSLLIKCE